MVCQGFAEFIKRKGYRSNNQGPFIPTGLFVLGYLIVWTVYSALATMVQWGLHTASLLTHTLVIASPLLGALLLVAAGVFQWTPFRDACMTQCRSPFGFIMTEWREGHRGALIMGLKHGIYCVGCCWMLMVLSFVLGVMNMFWMAALTAFMVLEKVTGNKWISRIAGMILLVWGLWGIAGAFIMLPHASLQITEVTKRVGDLEAEMRIDRNPPVLGDNNIEIELKDAAGRIITEAKVLVNYYMPLMPRMAPMNYIVDAKLKGDKYRATMNFIMSGPWVIAVKINQGGKISTAKFNVDAQ